MGINVLRVPCLLTATVALAVLAPSAQAYADPAEVACGMVLTTSVTLTSDLDCTGDALIVGADGITIDLGGHSITGSGTGVGIGSRQHGDLTIRDGAVAAFATGVDLSFLTNATIAAVELRDTRVALDHSQAVFDGIVGRDASFALSESNGVGITGSDLSGGGVDVFESDRLSIEGSQLTDCPVLIHASSRDTLMQQNTIKGTRDGVLISVASPRTHVIGNTFLGNGVGVLLKTHFLDEADGTVISDNTFVNNGAAGLLLDVTDLIGAPTVRVTGNRFIRNGFDAGGRTDQLGRPVADGAHISAPAGSAIVVADNLTNHNASYGIFAEPGTVVDGGGNTSVGDPNGCLGVVCG